MKTAIVVISGAGTRTAQIIRQETGGSFIPRSEVAMTWKDFDAFVFIGAMGICVRTIAPLLEDKHSDPAVVCVDTTGQHVIPVVSGHIGGANELAARLSSALGTTPVITTQSDVTGLWALDTLEKRFDWPIASEKDDLNDCIFGSETTSSVAPKDSACFLMMSHI